MIYYKIIKLELKEAQNLHIHEILYELYLRAMGNIFHLFLRFP